MSFPGFDPATRGWWVGDGVVGRWVGGQGVGGLQTPLSLYPSGHVSPVSHFIRCLNTIGQQPALSQPEGPIFLATFLEVYYLVFTIYLYIHAEQAVEDLVYSKQNAVYVCNETLKQQI